MLIGANGLPNNWVPKHLDIKTVFLNGYMDRECYVSHTFNTSAELQTNEYYLLRKILSELRQAAICGFIKLKTALCEKFDYKQLKTDAYMFLKSVKGKSVIILIYFEDIVLFCTDVSLLNRFAEEILDCLEGTDHGNLRW